MVEPSPATLVAKSPRGAFSLSLASHCGDTEQCALRLFSSDVRWGRAWRRFFRIGDDSSDRFLVNLRVAALFHDLGKANEDFYRAVTERGFRAQSVRHEHLSALVLQLPDVALWLARNDRLDRDVITAAVLSHHCKAAPSGDFEWCQPRELPLVRMYLQHPQIRAILGRVADVAELGDPPALPTAMWEPAGVWAAALAAGRAAGDRLARSIRKDPVRKNLVAAVKAAVIVADAAASGLVREGYAIEDWIRERADGAGLGRDEIREKILAPRIAQVEASRRQTDPDWRFTYHGFQEGAAVQGSRAVLLAACGTGKTLAA